MSILKQIYDTIAEDGTETFFPSQHSGECIKEYVVIKLEDITVPLTVSSERPLYTIMCYVPQNNYSRLESLIYETKQKLKKMYPTIMYIGNETASFYDSDVKGHMKSFQYTGCRKIEQY